VTGVPLNETVDEPWAEPKYLPVMVTAVPTAPDVGEREVMRGGFTAKFQTGPRVELPQLFFATIFQ